MKKLSIALSILFGAASGSLLHAADPYLPTNYDEPYRGQYHFSQPSGWMNDINGIWFDNGVYHLTCQAYAYSLNGGNKSWAHATSTDMLHWTQQANALDPDVNVPGECYSGSTVVDVNNTSGFGTTENPPLVTIYTATSKGTCLAYSLDKGATWIAYSGNPVNVGGPNADTRDPHVFWYAPTNKWVCALFENGTTFYTSSDLKTWTKTSTFNFGYECPDIFELAVDGGATKKWVLLQADSQYYIGTFDGETFTPDAGGPYRMVNNSGIGGGFYASQTFFKNNSPSGRTIQMAWMSGMGPGSTSPWTHNSTFPCEVKLQTYPEGVRASRTPISEISSLYGTTQTWGKQTIRSGQNLFAGKLSKCFDVEAEFDVTNATVSSIIFKFANKSVTYDLNKKTLFDQTLAPINNKVKIRFLVDWGELEAFGNDGQFSHAENFAFTPEDYSVSMTANGSVSLVSARFSPVNRTWEGTPNNTFIDDPDAANTYSGNWITASNEGGYYKGTLHVCVGADSYVEAAFTGTQVSWYGLKNDDLGMADIYIDGVLEAENIDCYSTVRIAQQLFTKSGLSNGNHTIKMVMKGTKNPASKGTALVHDYFGYVAAPTLPTAVDDASDKTTYTGNWVTDVNGIYYKSTCHVSNTADSYLESTFTGTQVFWYGLKNDDLGMAAIYIDGVLAADNIDCYGTTREVKMLFSKTNLTDGTHTIKVVVKGTKNAASKGTALVHDYFDFPVASANIIDDYSSDVAYTGNWLNFNNDNAYYNRTCHVAIQTNSDFTLTFTGNQVAWYGLKNDDLGMATIYIDDVLAGDDIDCYGTDRRVFKLFSKDGLSNGSHTFRLVQKGTKNPASKGTALVHDYISVSVPNSPISAITGDLTFGDVEKNTSSIKTFTISNTNILPLSVSNIVLPAGFSTDWTGGDIKADTTKEIKITFSPTEVKNYTGMIKIFSNSGIDSIAVNGTGFIVTDISENASNKFRTYPNPVQNTLNIETNDPCNIAITDLSGKMLASKIMVGTSAKIDLSNFPKGLFLLKATNKKGDLFVQKIVKN